MSGIARLTDFAMIPVHGHGSPCCASLHPACCGPSLTASPNVNVNGLPAMRITDMGAHTGPVCCGPNIWMVVMGSAKVYINGLAAARLGDLTTHCGAFPGAMIMGSGNVLAPE